MIAGVLERLRPTLSDHGVDLISEHAAFVGPMRSVAHASPATQVRDTIYAYPRFSVEIKSML
jgi:hypothetical protein